MKTNQYHRTTSQAIEDAIIDLYLSVKLRKQEEIEQYSEDIRKKEIIELKKSSPLVIIDYIKSSIEILVNLRVQERISESATSISDSMNSNKHNTSTNLSSSVISQYEEMLREQETEIRKRAQREMQLKFKIESLESKIHDLENTIYNLQYKHGQAKSTNEHPLSALNCISGNHEVLAMSFGCDFNDSKPDKVQNTKILASKSSSSTKDLGIIPEINQKLLDQKKEFDQKFFGLEQNYREQIKNLAKRLETYEKLQQTHLEKRNYQAPSNCSSEGNNNKDILDHLKSNNCASTRNNRSPFSILHSNNSNSSSNQKSKEEPSKSKANYNSTISSSKVTTKLTKKPSSLSNTLKNQPCMMQTKKVPSTARSKSPTFEKIQTM